MKIILYKIFYLYSTLTKENLNTFNIEYEIPKIIKFKLKKIQEKKLTVKYLKYNSHEIFLARLDKCNFRYILTIIYIKQ